jgi:Ca2+-binding RTX toxin-like protein
VTLSAVILDGTTVLATYPAGTVTAGATLSFTPPADFNGTLTAIITANDGNGGVVTKNVAIVVDPVNDAPVVSGPALLSAIAEDAAPITITASALLANASDPDAGDVLSVTNVSASSGTVVQTSPGNWTYTPAADFNGTVTFSYDVIDGNGGTVAATASMAVTPVNDAPIIGSTLTNPVGLSAGTVGSTGLAIGRFTVLDAEGDPLTMTVNDPRFAIAATTTPGLYELRAIPGAVFTIFDDLSNVVVTALDPLAASSQGFDLGDVAASNAALFIGENLAVGTVVGTITAPQGLTNPTFSFATSNSAFAVNAATGVITTLVELNFEAVASYSFDVVISGNEGNVTEATTVTVADQQNIVNGTANADTLNGTAGEDSILGLAGSDLLNGGARDDALIGDLGDDTLNGGAGADRIDGGGDSDTVSYLGSLGPVTIDLSTQTASGGDAEGDTLVSIENVIGSAQADTVTGSNAANRMHLGDAADVAFGLDGNDTIFGEGGNDSLTGGDGVDQLDGGAGNDSLMGGNDNDFLTGGVGDDLIMGGSDFDYANYSDGTSTAGVNVSLAITTAQATGGAGTDTLAQIEGIYGSQFNDTLTGDNNAVNALFGNDGNDLLSGGGGFDMLSGGEGDDTLDGGTGDDFLLGGNGTDTLTFANATSAIYVDMISQFANGASSGFDAFSSVERVIGSTFGDNLLGSNLGESFLGGAGTDILWGFGGDDQLDGGADIDYILGGAGNDTITTGAGQDFVYFLAPSEGGDTITDWRANGFDLLVIDNAGFGGLFASNAYLDHSANAPRFVNGTTATASFGQFIWNGADSMLSWDADGTGSGAAVQIVRLTGVTTLGAADILVL